MKLDLGEFRQPIVKSGQRDADFSGQIRSLFACFKPFEDSDDLFFRVLDALHGISRGARFLPRGDLNRNWTCFRGEGQTPFTVIGQ